MYQICIHFLKFQWEKKYIIWSPYVESVYNPRANQTLLCWIARKFRESHALMFNNVFYLLIHSFNYLKK